MWALLYVPQSDAIDQYMQVVDELVGAAASEGQSSVDATATSEYKEILVTQEGGALTITLNRPKKYNAINYQVTSISPCLYSDCLRKTINFCRQNLNC